MKQKKSITPVKLEFGDAVVIDWVDIHNDEGGWKPLSEVSVKPAKMKSLGYWVGEMDDHYVLSADLGDDGATNTRMFFPKGCVSSMKRVKRG